MIDGRLRCRLRAYDRDTNPNPNKESFLLAEPCRDLGRSIKIFRLLLPERYEPRDCCLACRSGDLETRVWYLRLVDCLIDC
jgi:hypothetical protein